MGEYIFESDAYTDTYVLNDDGGAQSEVDHSANQWAYIGMRQFGPSFYGANRYLFYCDISALSGTASSAILKIRHFSGARGETCRVMRTADTDWTSAATWLTKDAANPWSTNPGGDPVDVPGQQQQVLPGAVPAYWDIDVTALVQDAIDNRSGLLGIVIALDDESPPSLYAQISQGNSPNAAVYRPVLTVNIDDTHTLTLDVGSDGAAAATGEGVVDEGGGVYTCPDGSEVTVTITPDSGFQIDTITGDAVLQPDGTYLITMLEDETVAITFVAYWTLVLTTSGNGVVDVSPDVHPAYGEYKDGEVVTLTVDPDDNNNFDAWSGADAADVSAVGGAVYQITMDADKTIQADFAVDTYLLTLDIGGGEGASTRRVWYGGNVDVGNEDDTWTIPYGTIVTIQASASAGYYLSGWSGAPEDFEKPGAPTAWYLGDSTVPSGFTMTQNETIVLVYTEQHTITVTEAGGDHGSTLLPGWDYDPKFIAADSAEDPVGTLIVYPDVGYQAQVVGDTAMPYFRRGSGSGYSYGIPKPADDLEITVTWVAIPVEQKRRHAFPAPWVDRPWVDHPTP